MAIFSVAFDRIQFRDRIISRPKKIIATANCEGEIILFADHPSSLLYGARAYFFIFASRQTVPQILIACLKVSQPRNMSHTLSMTHSLPRYESCDIIFQGWIVRI